VSPLESLRPSSLCPIDIHLERKTHGRSNSGTITSDDTVLMFPFGMREMWANKCAVDMPKEAHNVSTMV
jgi:hypothetical protein